jgi:hypothetical protein
METSAPPLYLSVEDYLRHEANGTIRHEYVMGRIHPMAARAKRTI